MVQTKALPKGLIATIVEMMLPIVQLSDRLGLKPLTIASTNTAIRVYQQHLSPRKGFSCAHRRLYGQISCSEYFRQTVLSQGFTAAVPLFQQRLQDCHAANLQMRQLAIENWGDRENEEVFPKRRQTWWTRFKNKLNDSCNSCNRCDCSVGDCSGCDVDFGACDRSFHHDSGNCDGIDLTPDCGDLGSCDIGACDVGGCDCSF